MLDGVAKLSPHSVVENFQDLNMLMYVFAPGNHPDLLDKNFA